MFDAVDSKDAELVLKIDGEEIDPLFYSIEKFVFDAASAHLADAQIHQETLRSTQFYVMAIMFGTFVPGVLLVVYFGLLLKRHRDDTAASLIREATVVAQRELRLRSLVQNTMDVILICAANGCLTYQSPAAETEWGYSPSDLEGKSLEDLIHDNDRAAYRQLWTPLLGMPSKTAKTELRIKKADGSSRYVSLVLSNRLDEPSVAGIVATAQDITEHKALEELLTQHAFYDSLTGLPNRALFRDRLEQTLSRGARRQGRVGLLFLDLDNFKQINDSLGHSVGDELLQQVATRLKDTIPNENAIARLGGDEFVVLIEFVVNDSDATDIAERIAESLKVPFNCNGNPLVISASIGLMIADAGTANWESMLRDADIAMYRAKNAGKAQYAVFDSSMQADVIARFVLENDLREAVRLNQFVVYYQPIVTLAGGIVTEVEALVRWQHPIRGLISPGEFIPLAEASGLIVPIGKWVLEEACRQVAAWQRQYPKSPPLTVSVNLSPRQFQQPSLLDEIKGALDQSHLPADCLKLEITESSLMKNVESTITTLWKLKELGVRIAVDDFGTGYSSLAYLKRLPIDVLKIDRSFITGICEDEEDKAIVQAIVALARSLNLSITAEGIETESQLSMLQSMTCEQGQGYLFHRPLEGSAFEAVMRGWDDRHGERLVENR